MATAKKTASKPASKAATSSTSTAVAKRPAGNIVSIQEQLKAQAAAMNERVAPASGINIVPSAKGFKLPDGTTVDELQLVIVDFVSLNLFYEGAFDKDNISPPACFAIGTNPLQLVPSQNSPAAQSSECRGCPMNEFGSNGNGKACKNHRLLAVLPPDADEETPMWLLKVSPTALKSFDGYVRTVTAMSQMPPVSMVTTVSLDSATDYPKLVFSNPVPNENLAVHFARQEEARTLLNTEPDVSQFTSAKPAKKVANARGARR